MNIELHDDWWRVVGGGSQDRPRSARLTKPQEGDVLRDVFGTKVFLHGQWNVLDPSKPLEVERMRKEWLETAGRQHIVQGIQKAVQQARTAPKRPLGAHWHVGKDEDDEEEETTYTEVELDNATLESYTQGKRDFANELLQLLAAEEEQLRVYGRTELYGIHKAVSIIHKALSDIQQEEPVEQTPR